MELPVTFDRQGLIPVVIQDDVTNDVLMVAFMNGEALRRTRESGYTHFYSRSRNTIWRKGEQSGHTQQVKSIYVNCEENSLLLRVVQQGGAACHEGYHSCYYRRLQDDNSYETIAERVFDPKSTYTHAAHVQPERGAITPEMHQKLESIMRQLYGIYLYLRDHDLSEESNTSRLLQERSQSYLTSRLGDELEELAEVQSGEHVHTGRQSDTVLEGSQVGYWLFLLAAGRDIAYPNFEPHRALLEGYEAQESESRIIELREECLRLVAAEQPEKMAQGLAIGFRLIGWACAAAGVDPLAPSEFDLGQMRRKGLVP
ncbi:phosphoribosyl-AMP cyclohydrolase [Ktedonospora formicarum]|uniref:Phosphoribosyl-AMP cyclohydrolase n=1 Tax=Ktedonospora formicarum TaxID=2778364 RepID=A0A8J3HXP9_9CHLR|nr:phosphoribosyl-AMP cyclohydrolase [Ktedonospora formicarum]GHO42547.1 hypothetical protein KSX_07100 [Ktedonospora formicarum]